MIHLIQFTLRVLFPCAVLAACLWPAAGQTPPFPLEIHHQEARLTNAHPDDIQAFGYAVDLDGDTAAVGAWGLVEIFRRQGGAWTSIGVLESSTDHSFGQALALEGKILAVSAYPYRGEAHIYEEGGEEGLNAWNLTDYSGSQGLYYQYRHPLTLPQRETASREGWTLSIRSRMMNDTFIRPSCFVDITIDPELSERYLLFFGMDLERNLVVELGGLEKLTNFSGGLGWTQYHLHEVVFDPKTGSADYFLDGEKKNSAPWKPTPITGLNGVRFGNGSSAGTGSMNFNQVELKTAQGTALASYHAGTAGNPATAPDPEDQGWNLSGDRVGQSISFGPVSPDGVTLWRPRAVLRGDPSGNFGAALAMKGNWVIVSDPLNKRNGQNAGAVFAYQKEGSEWIFRQELEPNAELQNSEFGHSLAFDGQTMVVGAHRYWEGDNTVGRAFVFVRNGNRWVEQAQLMAGNPAQADLFGYSVAVSGDWIVVGARLDDEGSNREAGAVYVFQRHGTNWIERQRLVADHPNTTSGFGASVAIDGELLVVGQDGSAPGPHYLFYLADGKWTKALSRSYDDSRDPVVRDVDIDGLNYIVGAPDIEDHSGPAYIYKIDYGDVDGYHRYIRKQLYYSDAQAAGTFDPLRTVFRYKRFLYAPDDNGKLRARFKQLSDYYGPDEEDYSHTVERKLLKGLSFQPEDPILGNLLLDIYYDRTVAETIPAKTALEEAENVRFLATPSNSPQNLSFAIDQEIESYRQALELNRAALNTYIPLLTNHLGIAGEPPLGFRLFQKLVPGRALASATTTNAAGDEIPVTEKEVLFTGYKDLVLLFDLLRDHGRMAETLGRLLIGRSAAGDREKAMELITQTEQFLLLQGSLLRDMFDTLPPAGDASGLAQAIHGWESNLAALAHLETILAGNSNLLGFADDFMMFVQKFSGQTEHFDSYDALRARLDPRIGSNPLQYALQQLEAARDSYGTYRGYEDQLAEQFQHSSITYEDRLRDIVGAFPNDPRYGDNPTNNPGSELDQQYRSIELARLQIRRNQAEINNLEREIELELAKAESISNVMIRFGQKQARLTEKIGDWSAAQAGASSFANGLALENVISLGGFAHAANGVVQIVAEKNKAAAEAEKEKLAALEQATITGIESEAAVKTLALRFNTLAVESMEATVLLQQELNRLAGLYREKADLEQKIAERDALIASRYFADPIHRLRSRADMVEAGLAFNEAQKWIYFLVRALEYKWNTPFANLTYPAGSNRRWSAQTLFQLRNAEELEQMYRAMDTFDNQIQLSKGEYFDWFSVREDFFGYKRTNNLGQAATYSDPISGELVDAISAFRSRLRQLQDDQGNIVIRFNTVRELPGGTFFRGPRFNSSGQVPDKGLFLDKIRWIKINLPGDHSLGRSQLSGQLRYGGTSFIRNFSPGTLDPQQPDRLRDEMTSYTTRFWFFHAPSGTWRFSEALSSTVPMQLSPDPRTPPTVQEIDIFKERSVAATDWQLTIPTRDLNQPVLNLDRLDDVELFFYHYAVTRP